MGSEIEEVNRDTDFYFIGFQVHGGSLYKSHLMSVLDVIEESSLMDEVEFNEIVGSYSEFCDTLEFMQMNGFLKRGGGMYVLTEKGERVANKLLNNAVSMGQIEEVESGIDGLEVSSF